ncbi:Ig-like domain-containing protein [Paenibacillus nasutitermitis]|uniref:BIG2 domain-containing protein n=1 Tax=Paenibacillus nasutitermitis TaxID=1652958 RepID=A0A917E3X1_9BACL|nr:Ig-like domain-containing protein [Paenibacillus nasutitermitis]GGD99039.1 hypothetical protein GCM10010911_67340 [Paenibacillus nasutitermitis]
MSVRKAMKLMKSSLVLYLLLLSLLVSGMPGVTSPVAHASGTSPIVYKFTHIGFPGQPTQPGWSLVGLTTTYPVLGYQSYGAAIGTENIGMSRDFLFDVPEDGTYLIKFKGFLAGSGAIAELQIDGKAMGAYDFYGATAGYGPTTPIRYAALTAGTHTLTLKTIGKQTASAQYRMTPSEFILEPNSAMPSLAGVALAAEQPDIFLGSQVQLAVHGQTNNGVATDLPGAQIQYASDNEAVALVDSNSGILTAAGAGAASVTANVYYNGANFTAVLPINVRIPTMTYKFTHIGFPGQPTQPGWSLVGLPTTYPVLGYQYYGAAIGTESAGMSRDFRFDVSTDGTYLIKFKGFLAGSGAIAELEIDGKAMGTYDFYGATAGFGPTTAIRYAALTAGTHTLTLKTIGKQAASAQYRMTPSEFILEHTPDLPVLDSVAFTATPPELYVGSKFKLPVIGMTQAGIRFELAQEYVQYSSSDENVATVDHTGMLTASGLGTATVTADVYLNGVSRSASLPISVTEIVYGKTRSTIYTAHKIAAARSNIDNYAWAADLRDDAVARANSYLTKGLNALWELVPPQSLPRSYSVNEALGSPVTGKEIDKFGPYPYITDPLNDPWKITDPSSGYRFPTNDFGAYYRSGLDQHGIFDPTKADRSLLVNTLYPEKGPTWGVDDGTGWVDENGKTYTFIAFYIHWGLWADSGPGSLKGLIPQALDAFRDAYLYTGDIKYARAGVILLDRIADIYPSLDTSVYNRSIYQNSDGYTRLGKATGSIWETLLVKHFLYAYDAFYPAMNDSALLSFLGAKSDTYDLGQLKFSASGIRRNIEDGIVKQIYPGVQSSRIRGNPGFHQSALALAAVVYDKFPETKEWLDFDFQSGGFQTDPFRVTGGNIGSTLVNDVDRDGNGNEAAPLYNSLWLINYLELANILDGYDLYPSADLYQNVKFRNMFSGVYQWMQSEVFTPSIGDSGSTGKPLIFFSMPTMIEAFKHYQDPEYAQLIHFLNGFSTEGLYGDIFSSDPEQIADDIDAVIAQYGPLNLKSTNMTGTGFAALRDGKGEGFNSDTLRNVWMYYGNNSFHGHRDTLQIGLNAFGLDLTPDLGYPETTESADTHNYQWVRNTISHNTVVVDKAKQQIQWDGDPQHFDDSEQVKLIDVDASDPYPRTELYKRTTAMIKVDDANSYTVDFFRIKGGNDHNFSFHAAEGPVTTDGLTLVSQKDGSGNYIGSYAGENVEYGKRAPGDSVDGPNYMGSGFHYLKNVDRDTAPAEQFSVDWDVTDTWNINQPPRDVHLRLTMLGQVDDVALADGSPSQRVPNNPKSFRYVVAHRGGSNLDSLFTSIIEPYESQRYVQSIEPVTVTVYGAPAIGNDVKAVKVVLTNGRTDYIVSALDPSVLYTVDGKFQFQGAFGVYSVQNGEPVYSYLSEGTLIGPAGLPLIDEDTAQLTGTVADFTRDLSMTNDITVNLDLQGADSGELVGKYVYIANDGERNAVYKIHGVTQLGTNQYKLDLGTATLIRRYVDNNDFSKGYVYDIAPGAAFRIPLSYETVIEPVAANKAPVAQELAVSTLKKTAVSGTLTAADGDADQLTYRIVQNGTIGTAVITNPSTGSFIYTPRPGKTGSDTFTFQAFDGQDYSNIASVSITINPKNPKKQ